MATNEIVASVITRITDMQETQGLTLPANYNATNALQSAWLILSDPNTQKDHRALLDKTTAESQAKSLLSMVVQGLSPAKNQVYFIPYGQQLTLTRSYFGSVAILKRLDTVQKVWAEVVHQGDEFKLGSDEGRLVVKSFEPDFANQDKPLVGAFAVIVDNDGQKNYTVMTKKEIDQSWSHAKTKNVQNEFPTEMAKRTILNRAAKFFINSSSDNDLLVGTINETTREEYDNDRKEVQPVRSVDDLLNTPVPQSEQEVITHDKATDFGPEPAASDYETTDIFDQK